MISFRKNVTIALLLAARMTTESANGFVSPSLASSSKQQASPSFITATSRSSSSSSSALSTVQPSVSFPQTHNGNDASSATKSSSSGRDHLEMEAQRLLQQAKALRDEAAEAQSNMAREKTQKQRQHDLAIDELIETYFFSTDRYSMSCTYDECLLNRLRDRRLGLPTLVHVVDRIYQRETLANEALERNDDTLLSQLNFHPSIDYSDDANRLDGCIEALIELHEELDLEQQHQYQHQQGEFHDAAFVQHYGGNVSQQLERRLQKLQQATVKGEQQLITSVAVNEDEEEQSEQQESATPAFDLAKFLPW
eukprot:CAMPEP_0119546482 /NCGR_PEP_ID=MMETSP1352-20130426/888_1 /TAXON_ID=265584 /ORGANISM="Stauroneis constricta, Strain CCMP1120" /LENGTH=308 /DNA_ID=CAMNT_0007591193 /DNA_START=39 /DNA_END=965 /DNA_ORIENTATION=-